MAAIFDRRGALVALVGAALLWSIGGVLIKWVDWHPMAIMGTRSAMAALLMLACGGRVRLRGSRSRVLGAVFYAITVMLYVPACKMTTAANAILLQYTAPVWIALFGAWYLKEKPSWIDWGMIAITLGGMTLFFKDGISGRSGLGDILALISGITIAWMMLFLRRQKEGSPLDSVLLGNILAALGGLPFLFSGPAPDARGWLGLVLLGFIQLGLSYTLYAHAIKHVTALEAIIVLTLEPILNPVWALLLIGERPTGWALLGGILVLAAVTARGILIARHSARPTSLPKTAGSQVGGETPAS